MTSYTLSPVWGAGAQLFDNNGNILSGGKIETYEAGSTTNAVTYTDPIGNNFNTNPIVADASGRLSNEIWLPVSGAYKFVLKDANNVLIATYDNIPSNPQPPITNDASSISYEQGYTVTAGAFTVGAVYRITSVGTTNFIAIGAAANVTGILFTATGVGSGTGTAEYSRTIQVKLRETVSVKDFGAVGNGVANDTVAIQAAIDSNRDIYFPAGTYLITAPCVFSNKTNIRIKGAGRNNTIIKCNSASTFNNSAISFTGSSYIEIMDVTVDQNNNSTFNATFPLVIFLTSTFVTVANSNFINVTYIGLALNQVQDFWIINNFLEHNTAVNSTNYNINVTSTTGNPSRRGTIRGNTMLRSSNIFSGRDIVIDGNIALGSKYGANIVTQGDAGFVYGSYVVSNNICNSGTGVDTDGVDVAGMEIGGISVVVSNNICNQNGGTGIAMLARNSIISNNICLGNGKNVGATDPYRSGILMSFVDATYGAHYCNVVGNRCGDDGTSSQKYGYYEQGSALNNISLMANNFAGNITAETYIQSTDGFYETNVWTNWVPTVTSTSGTITTVGTVSAKYRLESRTVFFIVSATITTNGTGANAVNITLPPILGGSASGNQSCSGREQGITGKALTGVILNGAQGINVTFYDGTYPGANGHIIQIQGFYEVT